MFLFPISFTSLQLDKKRVERESSRARHIPQMLQRSFRFTRRCTYYRQCGSCTLCSQVWDVQMTIVFVSVPIHFFFFPVSFVYCFAWPFFLYTRCKICNQDSDERHYFLRERENLFFYRVFSFVFLF